MTNLEKLEQVKQENERKLKESCDLIRYERYLSDLNNSIGSVSSSIYRLEKSLDRRLRAIDWTLILINFSLCVIIIIMSLK